MPGGIFFVKGRALLRNREGLHHGADQAVVPCAVHLGAVLHGVDIGCASDRRFVRKARPGGVAERLPGLFIRELAEKLFLSEGSIKQYINQIYSKLQIPSCASAGGY